MAAEDPESGGEKTEAPSGRRVAQSREEGMVAKSYDLAQLLNITAAFIALQHLAPMLWRDMQVVLRGGLASEKAYQAFTLDGMRHEFYGVLLLLVPKMLALMAIAALFGAGSLAIQTKFNWSTKMLRPKFTMLNPISGLRRIFSVANLFSLLKSIAKLAIIGPIAYGAFIDFFPQLINLMEMPMNQLMPFAGGAMWTIYIKIAKLLFILAILDYIYQWWSTNRQMKMTKVETKEEHKAVEGDERTRESIKSKGMQRIRQRILSNVRKADVVVTNPTHLSVALVYSFEKGSAPQVVAKGRGYMALKIREIAYAHKIPVIERKPLARALYQSVEVGQFIPYELYAAVAELLAYVYRLKGVHPLRKKSVSAQAAPRN